MSQYQQIVSTINGSTRVFALAGNPVSHSLSPLFWNAALRRSEINAVYVPFRIEENDAMTGFNGLAALNVVGCSVTRPLKRKAAEYCHFLHESARTTGAVNTIKFSKKGSEGWNTDATGLQRILARLNIKNGKALLLGNGASAQTALWALAAENFCLTLQIARSFADKEKFSDSSARQQKTEKNAMNVIELSWEDKNFAYAIKESDIIINTTPLGWSPEDFLPEFDKYLEKKQTFVDFNYASASKLIASAHQIGCTVIDGRELLLEQGLESFELLTGVKAPIEVIRSCIYS